MWVHGSIFIGFVISRNDLENYFPFTTTNTTSSDNCNPHSGINKIQTADILFSSSMVVITEITCVIIGHYLRISAIEVE